jgi:two-component system cell cycle sensor histidine kinase/response regulator CckA
MSVHSVEPTVAPRSPASPEPLILLVEDEDAVREVTRRVLEHDGFQALDCGRPTEALRVASDNAGRLTLLLSDVVMPGMTGPELARELRKMCPELISIFMSGYNDIDAVRRVGPDPALYLQKPFTVRMLLSRVSDALSKEAAPAGVELSSSLLT